jgi:hypothetical protein
VPQSMKIKRERERKCDVPFTATSTSPRGIPPCIFFIS